MLLWNFQHPLLAGVGLIFSTLVDLLGLAPNESGEPELFAKNPSPILVNTTGYALPFVCLLPWPFQLSFARVN